MECTGSPVEACGGSPRLTVYSNALLGRKDPSTNAGSGSFPSLGCYGDNVSGCALPAQVGVDGAQ